MIIILALAVIAVAFWAASWNLHSSENPAPTNNRVALKQTPTPSINEFSTFLTQKKELPQTNEEVSLIAVGDISYSRAVQRIVKAKNNIDYPFLKISDYLNSADLVFGNLETPITPGREIADFEMIFRSNPGTEHALKKASFSILSLANNHTPNFGEKGLKNTFDYLTAAGIKYVGAGNNEQEAHQPIYIEKNGLNFAFLAYNDNDVVPASYEASGDGAGTAFMRAEKMIPAVKQAKQIADFVIVSMHSGIEYADQPNDSQTNFAQAAIDAGADLVIGHHPHVVQTLEKYNGKFIFYSLGNFVFDQPWSEETKESLAIKIYFVQDKITKISLLPAFMENLAQPRIANQSEAEKILKRLDYSTENQNVYYWDNEKNAFVKDQKAIIYPNKLENAQIVSKQEQADLDQDLMIETYDLKNGQLTLAENQAIIWQSPADWWVDNFILADSNNDGIIDINLSLWKSGDFGTSKPFWVEENDMSVKNHFFVLDFIDNSVNQVWGSSNLSQPNCEFKITDIDNDGKNDLIVLEGAYSQSPKCEGNYVAVWKWNGWGFSNQWRSEKENFLNLEIEKIDQKNRIITDKF